MEEMTGHHSKKHNLLYDFFISVTNELYLFEGQSLDAAEVSRSQEEKNCVTNIPSSMGDKASPYWHGCHHFLHWWERM